MWSVHTYICLHTHKNGPGNPLVRGEMLQDLPWTPGVCTGGLREWPTGEVGFLGSFQPLALPH